MALASASAPGSDGGDGGDGGSAPLTALEITGDKQNLDVEVTSGIMQMDTQRLPPLPILLDETAGGAIADRTSGAICTVDVLSDEVQGATCPVPSDLDVALAEPNTRFLQDDQGTGVPPFDLSLTATKGNTVVVYFAGSSLDVKNGQPDLVACAATVKNLSFDAGLDNVGGCGAGTPPGPPAKLTCAGRTPTYVGTRGADEVGGSKGDDVIVSFGGRDRIRAGKGEDVVCGGPGPDDISGGAQDDVLIGNADDDVIAGGAGDDAIAGLGGDDDCDGAGGTGGRGGTDSLSTC